MDTSNVREDGWEEQLIDYSLGVMDPAEAAEFELKLAECRQHVYMAKQYEQSVAWLGASVPAVEPPQGHKTRFMARIAATPQEETGTASPAAQPTVVPQLRERPSLSIVPPATETPVITATQAPTRLDEYRDSRRNTIVASLSAIAAAVILVVGLWTFLGRGTVISEGSKLTQLAPLPDYPGVTAFVIYNPNESTATLLADGLPSLPTGKVYELWILPKEGQGNPINAGVFSPQSDGSGKHTTKAPQTVSTYAGFAVTIEDSPGKDAPEGSMVVLGTFATP